jgi:hypothetical protein
MIATALTGRRRRAAPLDRQHADGEGMVRRRNLVQVAHVLEMIVLALAHHPMRLPEFFPLEHLGHRRIEADGVDPITFTPRSST